MMYYFIKTLQFVENLKTLEQRTIKQECKNGPQRNFEIKITLYTLQIFYYNNVNDKRLASYYNAAVAITIQFCIQKFK